MASAPFAGANRITASIFLEASIVALIFAAAVYMAHALAEWVVGDETEDRKDANGEIVAVHVVSQALPDFSQSNTLDSFRVSMRRNIQLRRQKSLDIRESMAPNTIDKTAGGEVRMHFRLQKLFDLADWCKLGRRMFLRHSTFDVRDSNHAIVDARRGRDRKLERLQSVGIHGSMPRRGGREKSGNQLRRRKSLDDYDRNSEKANRVCDGTQFWRPMSSDFCNAALVTPRSPFVRSQSDTLACVQHAYKSDPEWQAPHESTSPASHTSSPKANKDMFPRVASTSAVFGTSP